MLNLCSANKGTKLQRLKYVSVRWVSLSNLLLLSLINYFILISYLEFKVTNFYIENSGQLRKSIHIWLILLK